MRRKAQLALGLSLLLIGLFGVHCQEDDAPVEIDDIEDVEEEKAFLVIRKSLLEKEVVVGRTANVILELHNAGSSSALDVEVNDIAWPAEQFKHAGGSSSATYPRITAGSTVKFTYQITPLASGFYISRPATATYRDVPDATKRQAARSSAPHVYILTGAQKYVRTAITVGSYISLGSLRSVSEWRNVGIVLAVAAAAIGGQRGYKNVTEARKRTQYQRALEEVNKMK